MTDSFMSIIGALAWPAGSQGQSINFFLFKKKKHNKKQTKNKNKSKVGIHREWHRVCVNCSELFRERTHTQQNVSSPAGKQSGRDKWHEYTLRFQVVNGTKLYQINTDSRTAKKSPQIGTKRTTRWRKPGSGLSPHSSSLQRKYLVWCWSQWS